MSEATTLGILGVAATLAVAAIASMFRIVSLVIDFDRSQMSAREAVRRELWTGIEQAEARLNRRLLTLETHSLGYRRRFGHDNDNGTGK